MKNRSLGLLSVILALSILALGISIIFAIDYDYCTNSSGDYRCSPIEGYGYLLLVSFSMISICSWLIYKEHYSPTAKKH